MTLYQTGKLQKSSNMHFLVFNVLMLLFMLYVAGVALDAFRNMYLVVQPLDSLPPPTRFMITIPKAVQLGVLLSALIALIGKERLVKDEERRRTINLVLAILLPVLAIGYVVCLSLPIFVMGGTLIVPLPTH